MKKARTRIYEVEEGRFITDGIKEGDFLISDPKGNLRNNSFVNVEYDPDDNYALVVEGKLVTLQFTEREIATIRAGLRTYQWQGVANVQESISNIATSEGKHKAMTDGEIDKLCEYINK